MVSFYFGEIFAFRRLSCYSASIEHAQLCTCVSFYHIPLHFPTLSRKIKVLLSLARFYSLFVSQFYSKIINSLRSDKSAIRQNLCYVQYRSGNKNFENTREKKMCVRVLFMTKKHETFLLLLKI
jgi:hypothetical protein